MIKKISIYSLILVSILFCFYRVGVTQRQSQNVSFGLSTFLTTQGGTGTTSPSGILYGDNGATGSLKTATIGSGLTFSAGTLSATGGTNYLTNSGVNTYLNTGTFLQAPGINATSSTATSTIANFQNIFYVPHDFATNGCAGSTSNNTLDLCVEALLDLAVTKGLTGATVWITNDVPQSAWTATMDIDNNGLQVNLFCRPGTRLKYGGSGNAILWNNGDPTGHVKQEIAGCTFMGQNTLIAAGQSNSTTTVGIYYGGSQGAVGINTHDNTFNGFGTQVEIGANAYMLEFNNNGFSGGNGGRAGQGSLVHINTASNSGERNVFHGNNFTDPANSDADECFYIEQTGTASNFITNNSIDNCQIVVLASNGQVVISENHFENPGAPSGFAEYIPILGASSDGSVTMNINANEFANSATNRTWTTIIRHGGQLYATGNRIDNYNGFTVTNFVLHDLNNGQSSDHVCQTQVQNGALTNIIGGSGGVSWSLTNGVPCVTNRSNSYTIGLRPQGSNTNQFFSGNSTVGTFDHDGNWTLGDSAVDSLTTIYKRLYIPISIGIGTSSPFTMLGVAGTITSNAINATSTATSTIANLGGVLYAPAFQDAGEDIGKAINDAYAFCPLKSCIIDVPRGQFTFSTPILLDTDGKRALVRGTPAGGTTLTYSGTATSTTINWGIQDTGIDHTSGCGIRDIVFKNTDTATSRATSSNPIIGIEVGGTNGSDCTELTNVDIQGFGFNLWLSANNYNFNFQNGMIRNGGRAVHIAPASNSGELISFNDAFIVDNYATYGAEADQCFYMEDSAVASLLLNGVSMDDCQMDIGQANNVTINGGHWENVGFSSWGKYTYIVIDNNVATNVSINGTTFFNMATTLGNSPDQFISNGGTLTMNGVIFRRFGGITIPVAVTTTSAGRMTWSGLNNVSNAVFTELASGLPYTMNGSTGTSNFASMGVGTTTQNFQLTVSSTTKPQLSLGAGTGIAQWTFRNAGGNFYLSTTTAQGTATTSTSALTITNGGEYYLSTTTAGTLKITAGGLVWSDTSAGGGGYNLVQDEGTPLTARTTINCVGAGITCSDSGSVTTFTVTGSSFSGPINSVVTTDGTGNLQATGTQLTIGNLLATTTANSSFAGKLGIGSTTPWGKLGILQDSYSTPAFTIGTSTDSNTYGIQFHVTATSSTLVSNTVNGKRTEVGVRVGVGLWDYRGYGGLLDAFTVEGRLNTSGMLQAWCDTAQFTALTADGIFTACPNGFLFNEDNTGTTAINIGNSYQGTRVSASTAAINNDGAGVFFSPNASTGWLTLASSTPVMEVNLRIRNSTATTSQYFVGFTGLNIGGTIYEVNPGRGCFFTASSTQANWIAISSTGTATTTMDTGIASTSSNAANGTAYQYRFMRVQGGNGKCEFFMQGSGSANLFSWTSTTNIPSDTLLNPGVHYGIVSQNTSSGFDFFRFRTWWKDVLPSL